MASYSQQFEQAWALYRDGATAVEKNRNGKVEAFKVWKLRGLDGKVGNVLAWVATVSGTYSPGWRPGFQKYIRITDFDTLPEGYTPPGEALEGSVPEDFDWAKLIHQSKKDALRAKLLHPRTQFLYPESIVRVVGDMREGREAGPYAPERVIQIAKDRAVALLAEIRQGRSSTPE